MLATNRRHVLILGAGPAGLTSAMILAHRGFKVSVFEKAEEVGGRSAAVRLNGRAREPKGKVLEWLGMLRFTTRTALDVVLVIR